VRADPARWLQPELRLCDAASTWDASRFDLSAQLVHWPVDDLAAQARRTRRRWS